MHFDRSSPPSTGSNALSHGKFPPNHRETAVRKKISWAPPVTLWKYVLVEHASKFFLGFIVIFFILVIDLLVDIMDAILGKGLAPSLVLELFVLNFAWMIALAVPMAVLVAVLMAFGRMANDNEIVALMAAGVSPVGLCLPVFVAAGILAGSLIWFNNVVLPDSNYRARVLMGQLRRQQPAIKLKDREGIFIDFHRHVLRVDRVVLEAPGATGGVAGPLTGSHLEGIVVYEYDDAGRDPATVITAETGTIELWRDGAVIRLTLHDGQMIQVDGKDPSRDLRTDFDTQTIIINDERRDLSAIARESSGHRNDRELSASAMRDRVRMYRLQSEAATRRIEGLAQVDSLTAEERSARVRAEERLRENYEGFVARYMVEVHKKYSIPFAAIVFVLIGTPLGLLTRGAGRTAAVATSLVLFLVYWATLIGGEQLADTGMISPWLAMWGANIGVGLLGLVMLVAVTNNVRFASLLEALPRALEARRERKAARDTVSVDSSP